MTSYNRIFINIYFFNSGRSFGPCMCVYFHHLRYSQSGGKLLIPICATLYGGNKNGLVNIQKQMLERRSEMTCSEREINWDPRDENEADTQEAWSIPERQPHSREPGRPLRSWQEASDLPVAREERVWGDEVRRSRLSGACRDLQAITESLDLIRGEVCNPWKISELCQVRQRSSSCYKWSCAFQLCCRAHRGTFSGRHLPSSRRTDWLCVAFGDRTQRKSS